MAFGDLDIFGQNTKRKRTLTAADKKRIAHRQGWKCRRCGVPLPVRYHVDHIKPFAEGGSDLDSNLQALCSNCHSDKTENERHRKKAAKIREKERDEQGIFGGGGLFGAPQRRSTDIFSIPKPRKNAPAFDFGLPKPHSRKSDAPGFDFGIQQPKKRRKRKGELDFGY